MMKKIIAISALAAVLAFSFAGCGEETKKNVSTETKPAATTVQPTTAQQPATVADQSGVYTEDNTVAPYYEETTVSEIYEETTTGSQEESGTESEQSSNSESGSSELNYTEDQAVNTVMSIYGYTYAYYTGYYGGSVEIYDDGVKWHVVTIAADDGSLSTTYYLNDQTGEIHSAG